MIKRERYINKIDSVLALNKSIFLVGARQVGKTSLMKYVKKNVNKKNIYINFDEIVTSGFIEFSSLQEFIDYINGYFNVNIDDYDLFLFDEVVRVKNFNIILKGLTDKYENKNFICSASGNYEIVGDIIEGLAGRIIKIEVFPLDFKEFLFFKSRNIDLDSITENIYSLIENDLFEFLTFGGYPEVVLEKMYDNKRLILKSIVDSVFEKDLKGFIKNDKFIDLRKLIAYISTNIGSLFSYEGLSSRLGIRLGDLKSFMFYLEESHLLFRLNPFFTDKTSEYSKKQKLYFNDFGISNYLNGYTNIKNIIDGKDTEMTLFLNLKYNLELNDEIYFYQKLNGSEIDFIIKRGGKIYPIEAKLNNRDVVPKIFISFLDKYKEKTGYLIKTTKNVNFTREIEGKQIIGKPFYSIF